MTPATRMVLSTFSSPTTVIELTGHLAVAIGETLVKRYGIDQAVVEKLSTLFGISGICNILGAIKAATAKAKLTARPT